MLSNIKFIAENPEIINNYKILSNLLSHLKVEHYEKYKCLF